MSQDQSQSIFDPQAFMNAQITGANATQYVPCPVGEFQAVSDSVTPRQWTKRDDPNTKGVALDIEWSIGDPAVLELLGREKVLVRQGIMLDMTPSGAIDLGPGRNVALGRLRDALGVNDPNQVFSFQQLVGQAARVKVEHEIYRDAPMAKVTAVSRL